MLLGVRRAHDGLELGAIEILAGRLLSTEGGEAMSARQKPTRENLGSFGVVRSSEIDRCVIESEG